MNPNVITSYKLFYCVLNNTRQDWFSPSLNTATDLADSIKWECYLLQSLKLWVRSKILCSVKPNMPHHNISLIFILFPFSVDLKVGELKCCTKFCHLGLCILIEILCHILNSKLEHTIYFVRAKRTKSVSYKTLIW